jgi:nuclear GTP-binding protein
MYGVEKWEDPEDFLKQVAIRKGKLRKGGEPDVDATAKIILIDWQRGEIPYFHLPDGEVDKFEPKQEQTIDNVKEEEFIKMVGGTDFKVAEIEEEGEGEEGEGDEE